MSQVANQGLNIQKRTRIRRGAGIGPIHLLPPGGRPRAVIRGQKDAALQCRGILAQKGLWKDESFVNLEEIFQLAKGARAGTGGRFSTWARGRGRCGGPVEREHEGEGERE